MKKKEKQQISLLSVKLYVELQQINITGAERYHAEEELFEKYLIEAYEAGKLKGYEEGYDEGKS